MIGLYFALRSGRELRFKFEYSYDEDIACYEEGREREARGRGRGDGEGEEKVGKKRERAGLPTENTGGMCRMPKSIHTYCNRSHPLPHCCLHVHVFCVVVTMMF